MLIIVLVLILNVFKSINIDEDILDEKERKDEKYTANHHHTIHWYPYKFDCRSDRSRP